MWDGICRFPLVLLQLLSCYLIVFVKITLPSADEAYTSLTFTGNFASNLPHVSPCGKLPEFPCGLVYIVILE